MATKTGVTMNGTIINVYHERKEAAKKKKNGKRRCSACTYYVSCKSGSEFYCSRNKSFRKRSASPCPRYKKK